MDPSALVTFFVDCPSGTLSLELFGSWDNFSRPYRMTRDSQIGHGRWRGCHRFKSIVCDGDPSQPVPARDGALLTGGTYWYYYLRNGYHEFHDPSQPSTSLCPLLLGQPVNLLEVPRLQTPTHSRLESANLEPMTLFPDDRKLRPRPASSKRKRDSCRPSTLDESKAAHSSAHLNQRANTAAGHDMAVCRTTAAPLTRSKSEPGLGRRMVSHIYRREHALPGVAQQRLPLHQPAPRRPTRSLVPAGSPSLPSYDVASQQPTLRSGSASSVCDDTQAARPGPESPDSSMSGGEARDMLANSSPPWPQTDSEVKLRDACARLRLTKPADSPSPLSRMREEMLRHGNEETADLSQQFASLWTPETLSPLSSDFWSSPTLTSRRLSSSVASSTATSYDDGASDHLKSTEHGGLTPTMGLALRLADTTYSGSQETIKPPELRRPAVEGQRAAGLVSRWAPPAPSSARDWSKGHEKTLSDLGYLAEAII